MGKVRNWLFNHPVEKEINNLLEVKDGNFKPQDYYINILDKIDIVNFHSEFKNFKSNYPTVNHKTQIQRLGLLHVHLKNDNFKAITDMDESGSLEHYDNNSCFIYFFTVKEVFDMEDDNYETLLDKFLREEDGKSIDEIQYNSRVIKKDKSIEYEKLVYIGMTTEISTRLKAHEVYRKLHQERFKNSDKLIYIAEITLNEEISYKLIDGTPETETIETPLDVIKPYKLVNNILIFLESMLITNFKVPEFNTLSSSPKLFFYSDGELDPWDRIINPDYIKIENSSTQSIFFDEEVSLNRDQQRVLWENVPLENLKHNTKANDK